MRRRILLIVNPTSGRGRAATVVPALSSALHRRGFVTEVFQTAQAGEARAAAAEAPDDTWALLSVGGDGTLNEVVSGNIARRLPVAVFPLGTANLLARELGLPWHVPDLAEALGAGDDDIAPPEPRWIDLLRVRSADDDASSRDRICFACASVGLDADVVEEFATRRTGAIHFLHYVAPILKHVLRFDARPLTVEVDGARVAGPDDGVTNVLVANCRHYGGPFQVARDADPADGRAEILLLRPHGRLALMATGARVFTNRLRAGVDYELVHGTRVRLDAAERRPLQIDGDPGGTLPAELELLPRALPILGAPPS